MNKSRIIEGHPSIRYCRKVLAGEVLACKWVKLACERHLNDLEEGHLRGLYFDYDAADHALEFFEYLKLWQGQGFKGEPFTLAPHYQFITSSLMGWKKADGYRRFTEAHIEMARKGAKSTFSGGLGAYFLMEPESGGQIYTAATKKDQALIVWENIHHLLEDSIFKKYCTFFKHNISIKETRSRCAPLSSDVKSLDGLNIHFASLDELHAHPTPQVYNLISDAVGTRRQPLVLTITTAGFDQVGICYNNRHYITLILRGLVEDDDRFGIIYTLDTKKDWPDLEVEDDYFDEDVWVKAIPGLAGVAESGKRFGMDRDGNIIPGYMSLIKDVRTKARKAKEIPAELNNFLTKRMNIWTQQATRWISLELWDSNHTKDIYEIDEL